MDFVRRSRRPTNQVAAGGSASGLGGRGWSLRKPRNRGIEDSAPATECSRLDVGRESGPELVDRLVLFVAHSFGRNIQLPRDVRN